MATKWGGDATARAGEATVTILHVSDMQFGKEHGFGRLGLGGADDSFDTLLKRLTDDLDLLRKNEGVVPDLVALTGDLAEWGLAEEYDDVLQFCEGVQQHLGLARDRILVIPGNHDINWDLCQAYFSEQKGRRKPLVEPYWPKWEPYVAFFRKLYKDVERYDFKETAPYTWFELPDLRIVVAGLNSTMRESHLKRDPKDPESKYGHYGYVGEAQLHWFKGKLDEAAAKGLLRIGLVHHNAVRGAEDDDENLRDALLLEDHLGDRLNLLLHGHTHRGSLAWLGRNLPVVSTGSAAVKAAQRPEEVPNQYQVVQVHREGLRCWGRQYTPQARKWIGDGRVSKDGNDWRRDERVDLPGTHGTFGEEHPRVQVPTSRGRRSLPDPPGSSVTGAAAMSRAPAGGGRLAVGNPGICLNVKDIIESLDFYMALDIADVVMIAGSAEFATQVANRYTGLDVDVVKEYREDCIGLKSVVLAIGQTELEILHGHPGNRHLGPDEWIDPERIGLLACVPSLSRFMKTPSLLNGLDSVWRFHWYAVEAWFHCPDGLRISLIYHLKGCDPDEHDRYRREGDDVLHAVQRVNEERRARKPPSPAVRVTDYAKPGSAAARAPSDLRQLRRRRFL